MILLDVGRMKQLVNLMGVVFACVALTNAFSGPETYSGKEMKQVAPVQPACDFTWTGLYIGGNAGYAWGHADTDFDPLPNPVSFGALAPTTLRPDPGGFIGGGQLGYNYQWKWLVLGAETDFQGSDIEGDDTVSPIIDNAGAPDAAGTFLFAHERMQWLGTVRGRIGVAPICRLLIYGTGGLAYGNVDYSANTNFDNGTTYPTNFTETKTGWAAGGGIEYALTNHWTVRAEYLHYDLGDESRTQNQLINGVPQGPPFFVRYNFDTSGEIVRGGFNFKF
ncbi:MAG: porin family protein [Verrucomicrobia bacterium]|nr:porin family protein [Verrucomicrobiota bacterium]